jgi:hypothetical protein
LPSPSSRANSDGFYELETAFPSTHLCDYLLLTAHSGATSNYEYKPDEYVVISDGRSPDGKYSIAAHGEGELGDENFHLYLMNAKTGKTIETLEEVKDTLDTGADAFYSKWSADSREVAIRYRADRHEARMVRYRIIDGHAKLLSGPTKVRDLHFE